MTVRRLALAVALVATGCLSATGLVSTTVDDGPGRERQAGGAASSAYADDRREDRAGSTGFGSPLDPADGLPGAGRSIRPVALSLPTIGVDRAPITGVGVEPDGAMEIPGARDVGWYRFGPTPGEDGSAVLAAHIAAEGVDGVFRDLDRLDRGDALEVVDAEGVARPYLVVDVEQYDKTRLPFDDLFAKDGSPRLVLITCGGDFNPELRSYDSNVVAYAVPADEASLVAISTLGDPATVIDRWGALGAG